MGARTLFPFAADLYSRSLTDFKSLIPSSFQIGWLDLRNASALSQLVLELHDFQLLAYQSKVGRCLCSDQERVCQ